MIPCRKCYLFLISEFNWKDFVTRNEVNRFLFVSHAVDVLAYVLRVVWWLWSTAKMFKRSNGLWYRRQPLRLLNLHSFGLVASLVNTLPKWPPYATDFHPRHPPSRVPSQEELGSSCWTQALNRLHLNRLHPGIRRFRSCLYKWGMTSSAACECGAETQTVGHVVLQCPIHRLSHGLTVLEDETTEWLLNTFYPRSIEWLAGVLSMINWVTRRSAPLARAFTATAPTKSIVHASTCCQLSLKKSFAMYAINNKKWSRNVFLRI